MLAPVLLAALLLAAPLGAVPPATIERVEVTGARDAAYVEGLAATVALGTFDAGALARVRAALELMEAFESIEVHYVDGALRITVEEAPILASLSVECPAPCGLRLRRGELPLAKGQRVFPSDLEAAAGLMLRRARGEGYRGAEVDLQTRPTSPGHVAARMVVRPGPAARVVEIRVSPPSEREVIDALARDGGIGVGAIASRLRMRDVVDAWQKRVAGQGVIGASGSVSETDGSGGVVIVFELRRGPRMRLQINGREVSARKRRHLLEDAPESAPYAARTVCELLEEELEGEGYWKAEVACTVVEDVIAVRMVKGEKVRIVRVTADLPGDLVDRLRMITTRASGYGVARGLVRERLRRSALERDGRTLEAELRRAGYARARVQAARVEVEGKRATVHFPVVVGEREKVARLEVTGAIVAVPGPAALREGGGYSEGLLEEERRALTAAHRAAGYLGVEVEASAQADESGSGMDVRLAVRPGPRARVSALVVGGALVLSPSRTARLAGVRLGEIVVEELPTTAEERLRSVPVLTGVDVQPVGPAREQTPLLVDVREAPRYRFRYGLGVNSDEGPRVTLSMTDLALFRGTSSLTALARLGQKESRGELSLRNPYGWLSRFPLGVTLFSGREVRQGFSVERRGALLDMRLFGLSMPGRRAEVSLVLGRKDVSLFDVAISPEKVPRDQRSVSLLSAVGTGIYDRRDDPLNPSRGFRVRTSVEYAVPALAAEASFVKGDGEVFGYLPLARGVSVAAGVRAGLGHPLSGRDEVPISERFFLGGVQAMRAFDRDSVGPRDASTNEPLGGEAFHHEVVELRLPLFGSFGAALFYERGEVFERAGGFSFAKGRDVVGIGLRLRTGVGPIRLEYAREAGATGRPEDRVLVALGEPF